MLIRLIEDYIEDLRGSVGDVYCPYEPQKTQEILANLNGAIDSWEEMIDVISGDWQIFAQEEEDEQVGDIPEG